MGGQIKMLIKSYRTQRCWEIDAEEKFLEKVNRRIGPSSVFGED